VLPFAWRRTKESGLAIEPPHVVGTPQQGTTCKSTSCQQARPSSQPSSCVRIALRQIGPLIGHTESPRRNRWRSGSAWPCSTTASNRPRPRETTGLERRKVGVGCLLDGLDPAFETSRHQQVIRIEKNDKVACAAASPIFRQVQRPSAPGSGQDPDARFGPGHQPQPFLGVIDEPVIDDDSFPTRVVLPANRLQRLHRQALRLEGGNDDADKGARCSVSTLLNLFRVSDSGFRISQPGPCPPLHRFRPGLGRGWRRILPHKPAM